MRTIICLSCIALCLSPTGVSGQWQPDGMPVCVAADDQWTPQILPDGGGGVFLIWHDYRDGAAGIYAQHLDDAGLPLWADDGVPVCIYSSSQWDPQFASDGAGGFIAAWRDNRLDESTVYAQRISATGEMMWTAAGVPMSDIYAAADYVCVESDGAGGAIVVWTHEPPAVDSDILAQRVDPDGVLLWGTGGVAVNDYVGHQYKSRTTADGAGGVLVCWQDDRTSYDCIYAQRLDAGGARLWPADGVPACPATTYQFDPRICRSDIGEAIVTWDDVRGSNDDVFAQHIQATGALSWGLSGKAICALDQSQEDPAIVSDGALGAIIAWKDKRDVSSGDIYAQRIERDGDIVWTAGGVVMNGETGDVRAPELCSDNMGGVVASWSFWGGSETMWNLAAQRVNGLGEVLWGAEAVVVSAAARDQSSALQAADDAATVVFAWHDSRNGAGNDIYAQRVYADGTILALEDDDGGDPPQSPIAWGDLRLRDAFPNPFNPSTTISYATPVPGHVNLSVYDVSGRIVKTLVDADVSMGSKTEVWRGIDQSGRRVVSGVYFLRLETGQGVRTKKVMLAK